MLVSIDNNNKVNGVVNISNPEKEQEFLTANPSYMKTDFEFIETPDLYEYSGSTFNLVADWEQIKADREAEALTGVETINNVPQVISMRQARLALLQNGLLATVTSAIESGTDEEMKIEWEYAMDVRRDWESLNTMATSLGITEKQLDELFILAGSL
jgi:hypothetical protein